jgi:hypothetical protein
MEDNKELVLVYRGMPQVNRDDRFSVVITPQNYLLKKEHLAIKQEYQSKKIAASLFDEFIENNKDAYSFFVYKEDEDWIFIAYNQNEIMELLEEVGISASNVDEIFFAQQLVSSIDKPISLGEDKALVSIDGIATIVPKNILPKDTEYVHISDEVQPKKAVFLSKEYMLDSKTTLLFSIIFIIFGLLFLIESRNMVMHGSQNQEKIDKIIENNPALSSSYTRESILSKYQQIDKTQRAKREIVAKLSKIVDSSVKVDEFKLSNNKYSAILSVQNANQISSLINRAKRQGLKVAKLSPNQLKIEGMI